MKITIRPYMAAPFPLYFEEGETPEQKAEAAAAAEAAKPKTFTQEQVNTMMASNKKTLQAEVTKKTQALVDAQNDVNLSQEEKDALQIRVDELEALTLTDKELSARDKKKAKAEYDAALDKSSKDASKWKGLHDKMLIETAITQASLVDGQKAISPGQLVSLFARDAVVSEVDGIFSVQLDVVTVGEDKVTKILKLDPSAAIKEYASRPEYLNLFEDPSKDGLHRRKTSLKAGALPTNMAEYKANRKEILK